MTPCRLVVVSAGPCQSVHPLIRSNVLQPAITANDRTSVDPNAKESHHPQAQWTAKGSSRLGRQDRGMA